MNVNTTVSIEKELCEENHIFFDNMDQLRNYVQNTLDNGNFKKINGFKLTITMNLEQNTSDDNSNHSNDDDNNEHNEPVLMDSSPSQDTSVISMGWYQEGSTYAVFDPENQDKVLCTFSTKTGSTEIMMDGDILTLDLQKNIGLNTWTNGTKEIVINDMGCVNDVKGCGFDFSYDRFRNGLMSRVV